MKVLFLIISSPAITHLNIKSKDGWSSAPVVPQLYTHHKDVWKRYMTLYENITCLFLEFHPEKDRVIEDNTLYIKGSESYHPGLLEKTLAAFEYFADTLEYDYIIRTNLSSLWNFPALLNHLNTLPKEGVYSGFIGYYGKIQYISGSGFILSPDTLKLLVKHKNDFALPNIMDDIDIGFILEKVGVKLAPGRRHDFDSIESYNSYKYDDTVYHYRFRWNAGREGEIDGMMNLLDSIYGGGGVKPV